jgi:hypothetical protein
MGCKIMNYLFRLCFAMALVLIAIKGLADLNDNKGFVSQNLRLFNEKIPFLNLNKLRMYSGLIILIENYILILTACFLMFGAKIAKVTGFIAILIELLLVHNPIFYGEGVYRNVGSQYLAILGGILSF